MDSLYEVSQINEVNREWAAQIWARIDSYMDKFNIEEGQDLLLDNFLFYICVSILQYPIYLSRIVLTIIIIALTFILNKFFIFVNK